MREDGNTATYFLCVEEIVNALEGLGEPLQKKIVVWKVLRYIPMIFDSKVSVLEDRTSLDNVNKDELDGFLRAYEMRTE